MLAENCYIVSDSTSECMIVDCGAQTIMEQQAIEAYITQNKLKPTLYVLTHGHFDHAMGSAFIERRYGLRPVICDLDADIYKDLRQQAHAFGVIAPDDAPIIGRCVNDGDEVRFGNQTFKVIHTPGHSKGGVVYYSESEHVAFTGDTLFKGSIGRSDLPGGSMFQIIQSLRTLTQLPDETRILPGHGDETTIGFELASNPYLDR